MYFNREDYGSRIRSLRKKRVLTQEQLAEKMNVSTPYIAKIETGKQTGPVELAVEFAAFGMYANTIAQLYCFLDFFLAASLYPLCANQLYRAFMCYHFWLRLHSEQR